MHPFTPFVAEELYHALRDRQAGDDIVIAQWPVSQEVNDAPMQQFAFNEKVITQIRNIRKQNNIATKQKQQQASKQNTKQDFWTHLKPAPPIKFNTQNLSIRTRPRPPRLHEKAVCTTRMRRPGPRQTRRQTYMGRTGRLRIQPGNFDGTPSLLPCLHHKNASNPHKRHRGIPTSIHYNPNDLT